MELCVVLYVMIFVVMIGGIVAMGISYKFDELRDEAEHKYWAGYDRAIDRMVDAIKKEELFVDGHKVVIIEED